MTRLKRNQIANACKKGLCALSPNKRDWINDVHYNYNALYIGDIFSVFKALLNTLQAKNKPFFFNFNFNFIFLSAGEILFLEIFFIVSDNLMDNIVIR